MAILALRPRNKQESKYSGELRSSAFSGGTLVGSTPRSVIGYHKQFGGNTGADDTDTDDTDTDTDDDDTDDGDTDDDGNIFVSYNDIENNISKVGLDILKMARNINKKITPDADAAQQSIIVDAVNLSLKTVTSMVASSIQTNSAYTELLNQISKFALRSGKKALGDMAKYRKTSGFDEASVQTNAKSASSRSGRFLNLLGNAFSILGKRSKSMKDMTEKELAEFKEENKKKGIVTIDDGLDDKVGLNITDTIIANYTPSKDGGPARPYGDIPRNSVNINFDDTNPNSTKFVNIYTSNTTPIDDDDSNDTWKTTGTW